jgi:nucleotide-binding universal stress UspA family protein
MHWPPRRILVGTDFSASALGALRAAAALARRIGASIDLVHALPEAPAPIVGFEPIDALLTRPVDAGAERARAIERMEALAREVSPDSMRLHVVQGAPDSELLALRERLDSDLIALGAGALRGLRRLLLGSVAERVLRRPGAPLLLVESAPQAGEFKKIVVAQNDPRVATPWLELALRLAHDERSEVLVVHVVPGRESHGSHVALEPEHAAAQLSGLLARLAPTVPARVDVRRGDPAREIVAAARADGAHLVVMGGERNASGGPGRIAEAVAHAGLPALLIVWPERESGEDFDEA